MYAWHDLSMNDNSQMQNMFNLYSEMLNTCTSWSHEIDAAEIGADKSVQFDTNHSRNDKAVDWTTQPLVML